MKAPSPAVASCSTCGNSLSAVGECVACLVRLGFDETDAEAVFGDYEILRREDGCLWELGHGAMGVTYRAQDRVLNRTVALKVIEAPVMTPTGQKIRERFLREARATATFRHPNVAGVFQFGASAASDRCYYAMELVEGETLEALVRREGPLEVEPALAIAAQVTHALIAAATHGLVHRDLKPGNIMLARPEGPDKAPVVKVIDFGLAKAISESGNETELTHGAFLGTPAFASPEQFSGAPADARSDIYSLGMTLWYALTGEVPYGGKTIEEIRRGRSELTLPVHELVARKLPEPVIALLRRILAVDPAERPASARELMSALEACRAQLGYGPPDKSRKRPVQPKLLALAALLAVGGAAFFAFRQSAEKPVSAAASPAKSIAVLPFENLSSDKTNLYFADGVQDEITTTLAKVADLKVINQTSVMQFREAEKRNLREIGQQLGVAHLLEGSVQREEDRVRVTARLIDARTEARLWAERYEGALTDLFAIQSEIAQKTARQLKLLLSPEEQAALEARPTRDPGAYDFYLRAREIHRSGGAGGVMGRNALKQVTLLDEAVGRDPAFVRALCLLARVHLQAYWYNEDRTPARLELARKALESAELLQPENGEVHLARALFHYWGSRAYVPALSELVLAARSLPNDAIILFYIAAIQRRQGLWEESARTMQRALLLDPRNGTFALNLAWTYRQLRRHEEARRVVNNFLAWKADDLGFQLLLTEIDLEEKGNLSAMQAILARPLPANADQSMIRTYRLILANAQRDYRALERVLSEYAPWDTTHGFSIPREYFEGLVARGLGDAERAKLAFLKARERAAAPVAVRPDDAKAVIVLAKIDAKLGRKDEAVRAAERAVELLPVSVDAFDGALMLVRLAHVYADVGETDRALEVLQRAAALPGGPAYGVLQLDSEFDPLRGDPRFQSIVASLAPEQKR